MTGALALCARRRVGCAAALLALVVLHPAAAHSGSLRVSWDPNTEPDVTGYILAYGTSPGTHDTTVDVGAQSTWTSGDLVDGQRYYFVVRAYNTSGRSSRPSAEISGIISGTCTYGISPTDLHFEPNGGTHNLAVFDPGGCGWSATATVPWLTLTREPEGVGAGSVAVTASRLVRSSRVAYVRVGAADSVIAVARQGLVFRDAARTPWESRDAPVEAFLLSRPGGETWYLDRASSGGGTWPPGDATDGSLGTGRPVPGDYDGDGIGDYAIWRSEDGLWRILTAASGFTDLRQISWGERGDVPVPGDYDGDGRTDVAVWKPATGTWHVKTSGSDYRHAFSLQWGVHAAGDRPAVGDFDGDGRADIAVWRATTGVWYILRSHLNWSPDYPFAVAFGRAHDGDQPMVGDFDGDGTADLGLWRQSTGDVWFVPLSSGDVPPSPLRAERWGPAEAGPHRVVDIDGDNRRDIAVWFPVPP